LLRDKEVVNEESGRYSLAFMAWRVPFYDHA